MVVNEGLSVFTRYKVGGPGACSPRKIEFSELQKCSFRHSGRTFALL